MAQIVHPISLTARTILAPQPFSSTSEFHHMKRFHLATLALVASTFSASVFATPPIAVPEPGTFGLLAAGIAAAVAVRLIKRK